MSFSVPATAALLLWALASAGDGGAEGVAPRRVDVRVEPRAVKLGEPFTLQVTLEHDRAERYELSAPAELGPFELIAQTRARADESDRATTRFGVELMLFELGKHTLPPLTFEVVTPGATSTWTLEGVEVEAVPSIEPDALAEAALKDLKPLADVPVRTYRLLYIAAAVLAAIAVGYLAYRLLARLRSARAELPPPPPPPLEARVYAQLDALRREDLPGRGLVREYYFRLSEIVRGYLGERYRFEALECTSPELLERLRRCHTPGLDMLALRRFTDDSDIARYAKAVVDLDRCKGSLEFAYELVARTTPDANAHVP